MNNITTETKKSAEKKARGADKWSSRAKKIVLSAVFGFIWLLAGGLFSIALWYKKTFNISFDDLLFTLLSPIGGTGQSTVGDIIAACLPTLAVCIAVLIAALVFVWKRERAFVILRRVCAGVVAASFIFSAVFAVFAFKIPAYLMKDREASEVYEKEFIDPATVKITGDEDAKNLICIYLESMETTYAWKKWNIITQEPINFIPNMTALAEEYVSFSNNERLGGFHSIIGTGWTMGALMGTTSGVPFSLAVFGEGSQNSLGRDGTFLNGLTALGDILEEKGYRQEFLCGSDISFAGRDTYFTVHGNYELFDYYTAIEEGYIAEDYKVWWGFEDEILYKIAKDEITELYESGEPFNFTMLTVDPHHVGGYVCNLCTDEYESRVERVVSCADRQIASFIEWCKTQPFFEDTTIVIMGDHPRMDTHLVGDTAYFDRTMYNCFINSQATPVNTQNRVCTSLDMFPTILSAMGFTVEGERLGLGTNLFSSLPTLPEKYGYDWFEEEMNKPSDYYEEKFITK